MPTLYVVYLFILAATSRLQIELYLFTSLTFKMAAISLSSQRYATYFRLHNDRVLADIGTLEMIVYNLKSIVNFANLNMSFAVYKLLIIIAISRISEESETLH